ncbi:MAG: F0F1 ATP synthase subunit B [Bacilli bacterium]|nr:F0F1 ATP synthase subunit B [Bacilli bacterium]
MKTKNRNKKLFLLSLVSLFVLTSCDTDKFGDDLASTIESKLIPNLWAFLVQFIALLVMLFIVVKFAYKPVSKYLKARRETLKNEVDDTFKKNEEAKVNLEKSEAQLADTRRQADVILNEATLEANKTRNEILEQANQEALETRNKALDDIERAKAKATREVRNEIVDVALDATGKLLEREVNTKDNTKIVDDFIKGLEEESDK